MISKKILYSEQLLQLVLALSLLQVDPINYLEWGVSRIHSSGIGPWQLEVAPTPFSDYPYMNRKTYAPLIEDLARYDRVHHNYDVQAYLLNFDNAPPFMASSNNNNSAATANSTSTNSAENERNNAFSTSDSSSAAAALNLVNLIQDRFHEQGGNIDDIFLQSELYTNTNTESIIDQNLADLNDYDDHQLPHFQAVPTKTEVPDPWDEFVGLHDGALAEEQQENQRLNVQELSLNGTRSPPTFTSTAIIDWNDYLPFVNDSSVDELKKKEEKDEEALGFENVVVKKEETDDDSSEEDKSEITSNVELTVEEMDLIEVLWKQDVDLGYNPIIPALNPAQKKEASSEDEIEKLKALLELKTDKKEDDEEKDKSNSLGNPWAGLSYIVDTETGEYILQSTGDSNSNELDNLLLEEALQLVGIEDLNENNNKKEQKEGKPDEASKNPKEENSSEEVSDDLEAILENNLKQDDFDFDLNSPLSILLDDTDELDLLNEMMIQPSSTHFQHPRQPNQNYAHCVNSYRQNGYQGRVPLSRAVSMDQRWQDVVNLLNFPPAMGMGVGDISSHAAAAAAHYSSHYPYQASGAMSQHNQFGHHHHHPHSHPAVLHNASLAEIASQPPASHHYSSNLGSAVASSMHLTNSTSETDAGNTSYKMEHDMMYFSQTNPNELNHTNDGFLNAILNDEDLQLMDMAVNEGMYTMRMLDQNGTNSSSLGPNTQLNQALLGNHMHTNLSSGIGSSASSSQQHGSGDRLDASSDSAVSSMGSERVASLSDGEWNEAGSDSAQEYHSRKFVGPYDYRFNNSRMLDANRQPVAQKKHQMYGKRFAHESVLPPPPLHPHSTLGTDLSSIPNVPLKYEPYEPYALPSNNLEGAASSSSVIKPPASMMDSEMKYSYSIDFPHNRHLKSGSANGLASHELINHNHTYTMPHPGPQNGNGATPRPQTRDKKAKKSEDEHLTRDEKRARALQIPISVQDIINLPMDEFNERLSKYDLSENQLSLIRDIRRRGKNKVAAQNCRKRKLDQIISLADEVKDMKMRKDRFLRERDFVLREKQRVKAKFQALYHHIFTNLRDGEGNPYSTSQYSLQQSADGSIVLVPRTATYDQNSTENASSNGSGSSRHNGHHSGPGSNNNSSNFK